MKSMEFLRVAAAYFKVALAAPSANAVAHIKLITQAYENHNHLVFFPELSITGVSCGDLFTRDLLLQQAEDAVTKIAEASKQTPGLLISVGAPVRVGAHVYNCAVLIVDGRILRIYPKGKSKAQSAFYSSRLQAWLDSKNDFPFQYAGRETTISGKPFTAALAGSAFRMAWILGDEIPRTENCHIILHLDARPTLSYSYENLQREVRQHSQQRTAAYLYQNAGIGESSAQFTYGAETLFAENGEVLEERKMTFDGSARLVESDIDLQYLEFAKAETTLQPEIYSDTLTGTTEYIFEKTSETSACDAEPLRRPIDPYPFIPDTYAERSIQAEEVLQILAAGLARRTEQVRAKKLLLGVSGGLDSTLALLVCCRTMKLLNRPNSDILAIRMPGFGTSDETYNNAVVLMQELCVSSKDISIVPAILQHFKDIEHDPEIHDTSYENAQARERTQILMDIANKVGGIVIGTGDLSEIALGWSTYNGDQMSMYSVNSSIPKTMIRPLLQHESYLFAREGKEALATTLGKISSTPVSPELLPPDAEGKIAQKTEDIIGPYVLHDFFIYHFLVRGATPAKIFHLASQCFSPRNQASQDYFEKDVILKTLTLFFRHFYTQQFKRQASPDGIAATEVSLSPNGRFRIPSDLDVSTVLAELESLE